MAVVTTPDDDGLATHLATSEDGGRSTGDGSKMEESLVVLLF